LRSFMPPKNQILCSIRNEWVSALPEEFVRQRFIKYMIELGYPHAHIAVEKELRQLPHMTLISNLPDRRADIICFAKDIHPDFPLYPLLLVECKAVNLTPKVLNQVTGYNYFLKAYFVAVVNENSIKTGWYDQTLEKYTFIDRLPTYKELIEVLHNRASVQSSRLT
jgi:hypothetical protein